MHCVQVTRDDIRILKAKDVAVAHCPKSNAKLGCGVAPLGDLLHVTELDLLSYKNFGETSLSEIKTVLASKNLRLGQLREEGEAVLAEPTEQPAPATVGNEGVLATPLSQIEFSVRARKALERLGVKTLGELATKTEPELLACRNFGQTSLNEVQQRLAEYGMRLREA